MSTKNVAASRLCYLCRIGEEGELKQIVRNKDVDVNGKDDKGFTPLIYASKFGQVSIVRFLLKQSNIKVGATNRKGSQALHLAAENGQPEILKELLEAGADVNWKNNQGITALSLACECDGGESAATQHTKVHPFSKCVQVLLEHNADVAAVDKDGYAALHHLCLESGDIGILHLLFQKGADIHQKTHTGMTPLMLTSSSGYLQATEILLSHLADKDAQDDECMTSLHFSCKENKVKCVELLLRNGANPNLQKESGHTPLLLSAARGHKTCISVLLEYEAKVNMVTSRKNTALILAAQNGDAATVQLLLPVSDVNAKNETGRNALHYACEKGHDDSARILLDNGADVNVPNNRGFTPIAFAAEGGHIKCLELLLERCAHIEKRGKASPIVLARKKAHHDVLLLLEGSLQDKAKKPSDNTSSSDRITMPHLQEIAQVFLSELNLPLEYFCTTFDTCFCVGCCRTRKESNTYLRGEPPKPYGIPVGWCKFGLSTKPQAHAEKVFDNWHMAFHGTKVANVRHILRTGDLLLPGDVAPSGEEIKIPPNHWDPKNQCDTMKPPANHDVNKFYFSPSIRYAGCDVYAPEWGWQNPITGEAHIIRVAFQVRIQPGTYHVSTQTVGATTEIDPLFPNSELEWSTKRRSVSVLVGLLVKVESTEERLPSPYVKPPVIQRHDFGKSKGTILHDYIFKVSPGKTANLKAGDTCLIMSFQGDQCCVIHEMYEKEIRIPLHYIKWIK